MLERTVSAMCDPGALVLDYSRLVTATAPRLSGNVVGPWKTVISLDYGRAVASDIPDLVGKQEFLLIVLKLF